MKAPKELDVFVDGRPRPEARVTATSPEQAIVAWAEHAGVKLSSPPIGRFAFTAAGEPVSAYSPRVNYTAPETRIAATEEEAR